MKEKLVIGGAVVVGLGLVAVLFVQTWKAGYKSGARDASKQAAS